MGVNHFRFLTADQRDHLSHAYSTVVESWHSQWFGPTTPTPVSMLQDGLDNIPGATIRIYRGEHGAWVGIALEQWAEYWLTAALFDIAPDEDFTLGPVSGAVVDEALRDLARVTLQTEIIDESRVVDANLRTVFPGDAYRAGSSRIRINFGIRSVPVTLLVGSPLVEQQLQLVMKNSIPRNIEPVRHAIGQRLVPAKVELGSAGLSAEELLSLRVGDVVRIDQRLDQPVDLLIEGEQRLKGFLARTADGKKCIRLVAAS